MAGGFQAPSVPGQNIELLPFALDQYTWDKLINLGNSYSLLAEYQLSVGQDGEKPRSDAIATYQELARLRPDAPQAPKALWRAAVLLAGEGRIADATEQYLALARRYPSADEGWRGYQAAGLNYFRQGDWRRAGETWDEMARAALPEWTRPVANYWLGRAQAAAGEAEAARRARGGPGEGANGERHGSHPDEVSSSLGRPAATQSTGTR